LDDAAGDRAPPGWSRSVADFLFGQMATGNDLINYDGGKGFELIPWERVELLFNLPPYIEHNNPANLPADKNGFGDVSFLQKFRIIFGQQGARRLYPHLVSRRKRSHRELEEWRRRRCDHTDPRGQRQGTDLLDSGNHIRYALFTTVLSPFRPDMLW